LEHDRHPTGTEDAASDCEGVGETCRGGPHGQSEKLRGPPGEREPERPAADPGLVQEDPGGEDAAEECGEERRVEGSAWAEPGGRGREELHITGPEHPADVEREPECEPDSDTGECAGEREVRGPPERRAAHPHRPKCDDEGVGNPSVPKVGETRDRETADEERRDVRGHGQGRLVSTVLKAVLTFPPIDLMEMMEMAAMSATRSPYSASAAPSSDAPKRRIAWMRDRMKASEGE